MHDNSVNLKGNLLLNSSSAYEVNNFFAYFVLIMSSLWNYKINFRKTVHFVLTYSVSPKTGN